eukprot:Selendium_serpulae@DN5529_c1_g1_i2.p1
MAVAHRSAKAVWASICASHTLVLWGLALFLLGELSAVRSDPVSPWDSTVVFYAGNKRVASCHSLNATIVTDDEGYVEFNSSFGSSFLQQASSDTLRTNTRVRRKGDVLLDALLLQLSPRAHFPDVGRDDVITMRRLERPFIGQLSELAAFRLRFSKAAGSDTFSISAADGRKWCIPIDGGTSGRYVRVVRREDDASCLEGRFQVDFSNGPLTISALMPAKRGEHHEHGHNVDDGHGAAPVRLEVHVASSGRLQATEAETGRATPLAWFIVDKVTDPLSEMTADDRYMFESVGTGLALSVVEDKKSRVALRPHGDTAAALWQVEPHSASHTFTIRRAGAAHEASPNVLVANSGRNGKDSQLALGRMPSHTWQLRPPFLLQCDNENRCATVGWIPADSVGTGTSEPRGTVLLQDVKSKDSIASWTVWRIRRDVEAMFQ